jgi:hypothetical protein
MLPLSHALRDSLPGKLGAIVALELRGLLQNPMVLLLSAESLQRTAAFPVGGHPAVYVLAHPRRIVETHLRGPSLDKSDWSHRDLE